MFLTAYSCSHVLTLLLWLIFHLPFIDGITLQKQEKAQKGKSLSSVAWTKPSASQVTAQRSKSEPLRFTNLWEYNSKYICMKLKIVP